MFSENKEKVIKVKLNGVHSSEYALNEIYYWVFIALPLLVSEAGRGKKKGSQLTSVLLVPPLEYPTLDESYVEKQLTKILISLLGE